LPGPLSAVALILMPSPATFLSEVLTISNGMTALRARGGRS
jgi:hypothetical protein